MEFFRMIPSALYFLFRFLMRFLLLCGFLFLLFIPAFFLSIAIRLVWDVGVDWSLIIAYALCILTYIGYRINRGY